MATLRIEGGRRLAGRVAVEGNKNCGAAAPGRVPADGSGVRAHQRAAHPRRRGPARHARRTRRDGRGAPARRRSASVRDGHDRSSRSRAGRAGCAVRCCCSVRCSRARARRGSRRRAATFRRAGRSRRTSRRSPRWAPCRSTSPATRWRRPWGLSGASFYLDEASVTGTETALLAAAAAKGRTEIRHAAMEPHVVELCRFLRAMGVSIDGEGTSTIRVEAPARFRGATHRLDGDYIEAGSWGVVAAITGRRDRGDRRAPDGPRGHRCAAQEDGPALLVRRRPLRRGAFVG